MSADSLFRIRHLKVRKGEPGAGFCLHVPELTVRRGERLALTGPSGCGKSTLLDVLSLVTAPLHAEQFEMTTAVIAANGKRLATQRGQQSGKQPGKHRQQSVDLLAISQRRDAHNRFAALRRFHIGYVLQTGGLVPFLTVAGNLRAPRRLAGLPEARHTSRQQGEQRGWQSDLELVEALGIADHLNKYPDQLSVGERQRAAIARALVHEPAIVIADEPTAALDPENSDRVMQLFVDLAERQGTTLLVASHDHQRVARFGFRRIAHRFDSTAPSGETWAEFGD